MFRNKRKQEQAEKEFDEALEKVLSSLHHRVHSVYDNDAFNRLIVNKDIMIPILLLILMSKVEHISDRLTTLAGDLASTVEVDRDSE